MSAAPVTFLSDYGLADEYVGVCHGVIARRCPQARVIDITHQIPRHDVRAGAIVLRGSLPHMPPGVHLAVVDPGVGSPSRRALALRVAGEERLLVGPDNGLLALACEHFGGIVEAVDVGASPERAQSVSATFHGRDVFAPVAGALAAGAALTDVGEAIAPTAPAGLELSTATPAEAGLRTRVLLCDGFGNLVLDASAAQLHSLAPALGARLSVRAGGEGEPVPATYARTFSDVAAGELLLYEDGLGMVALAVNGGSAAALLGAGRDDELTLAAR